MRAEPGILIPDWPAPPSVQAASTLRSGGVSQTPWDSFNLAMHVGDDPEAVSENRRRLSECLQLPTEPRWLNQVHGCEVLSAGVVTNAAVDCDAVVATGPGAVCVVMTADCLPVLLCDRAGQKVAAIHAGWRGLAAGVIERSVAQMACPGETLMAWLGPAIGPRAFEVGDEVREAFLRQDSQADTAFVAARPGHWQCDLYRLARQRLQRLGVSQVFGGDRCTFSETDSFYSYRREGVTGRMATLIWINDSDGRA